MAQMLTGLRYIEMSAFIAAPLAGLALAQLGAEVIRVDPPGGGLDYDRWPVTADGRSLYWAGLNKGKRSVAIDTGTPEGRHLVTSLVAASGRFLTNLPVRPWMSYATLREARPDLIMAAIKGNRDGSVAVDYTVNAATGLTTMLGPERAEGTPINQVLPAWDIICAHSVATGLVAAELHWLQTGRGQLVEAALSDVAFAHLGHLGILAEAETTGRDRPPIGNHIYGSLGRDFATADGRRIMIGVVTARHWEALVKAAGIGEAVAAIARQTGLDLAENGGRFKARRSIEAILEPWFARQTLAAAGAVLTAAGIPWGPYQTATQALSEDPRVSPANPTFARVANPGIGPLLVPGTPLDFSDVPRDAPAAAPLLGQDTAAVLGEVLGLGADRFAALQASGVVATA
ncbi:MAG: CoA transferase [Alphaproteobacteria bacterium]|nr:CoA transferase [Alphaproteobacteria bacterium]